MLSCIALVLGSLSSAACELEACPAGRLESDEVIDGVEVDKVELEKPGYAPLPPLLASPLWLLLPVVPSLLPEPMKSFCTACVVMGLTAAPAAIIRRRKIWRR